MIFLNELSHGSDKSLFLDELFLDEFDIFIFLIYTAWMNSKILKYGD